MMSQTLSHRFVACQYSALQPCITVSENDEATKGRALDQLSILLDVSICAEIMQTHAGNGMLVSQGKDSPKT